MTKPGSGEHFVAKLALHSTPHFAAHIQGGSKAFSRWPEVGSRCGHTLRCVSHVYRRLEIRPVSRSTNRKIGGNDAVCLHAQMTKPRPGRALRPEARPHLASEAALRDPLTSTAPKAFSPWSDVPPR